MVQNKLLSVYNHISELRIRIPRLIDARKEFNMKKANLNCSGLDSAQKTIAKKYWGKLYNKIDDRYLSLYNTYSKEFDPRYIPDDLYYGTIDTYFNNALECAAIDDKNGYDLLFNDVRQPKTIARKINGNFLSREYKIIGIDDVVKLCKEESTVVIKKATLSEGGKGVCFWKNEPDGECLLRNLLRNEDGFIIQEVIKQHQSIARLHPESINSIRILTLVYNGKVSVLSSIIRMGANGSKVDNGHSGGCFAGIDDNGRLKDVAIEYMTGKRYLNNHPTTGTKFSESVIPNFDECKEFVKRLAPRLSRVSKLTSWDLSVDENGSPVLLETNLCYGGLFFHQISNGPVFGDMTVDILKEALKKQ